jgi:thiamine biosynthesis lipoprotein
MNKQYPVYGENGSYYNTLMHMNPANRFSNPVKALFLLILLAFVHQQCTPPAKYIFNEGQIYGTVYHIVYESPGGKDLKPEIDAELQRLTLIFSTFNPESQISKVNKNIPVELDSLFINCFNCSMKISELSEGAFDITVAPLVNAWGFGFTKRQKITPSLIDSLLQLTGYKKVKLENGKVVKDNPGIMLDMSAVAKGYTCDIIGWFLAQRGCRNYMVEIGGEVVAKGLNNRGITWNIGISKPDETSFYAREDIQAVVKLPEKALATSGNYRNFYIQDGKKFAHEINPHTGYPAEQNLLSTTVLANDCMTADAWATAFMVLGLEKSVEIQKKMPDIEVYFIYADESGFNKIYMSDHFREYLSE